MHICINGQYVDTRSDVFGVDNIVPMISVYDDCFLSGFGVYETLRTYGGRIWQMAKHLERLRSSVSELGITLNYSNRQIADMIEQTINLNGFAESRVRVTVSGGSSKAYGDLDFDPSVVVMVQPLDEVDSGLVKNGVDVITYQIERTLPKVKSCNLLASKLAIKFAGDNNAYEALLENSKGMITEGAISNVFFVKGGDLLTPKNDILMGTTRDLLIELAESEDIKVHQHDVKVDDLGEMQECFICNAPRGIVPVKKVLNKNINFNVGEGVTSRLQKLFADYIERFKRG